MENFILKKILTEEVRKIIKSILSLDAEAATLKPVGTEKFINIIFPREEWEIL